jgi:hypothetical protein
MVIGLLVSRHSAKERDLSDPGYSLGVSPEWRGVSLIYAMGIEEG